MKNKINNKTDSNTLTVTKVHYSLLFTQFILGEAV